MKVLLFLAFLILLGCTGSAIVSNVGAPATMPHEIRAIALAPSGGPLADSIGIELVGYGFTVIDSAETSNLMIRDNAREIEVMEPRALTALKGRGIDAVLVVRSVYGGDGRPESASVRLNSTHTGQILAGLSWQTGQAGMSGSIVDRASRANLVEAARQIAKALAEKLPAPATVVKTGS